MQIDRNAKRPPTSLTIVEGRHVWRCAVENGERFCATSLAHAREVARQHLALDADAPLGTTIQLQATTQDLVDGIVQRGCDADIGDLVAGVPFGVADIAELTGCTTEQIQRGFAGSARQRRSIRNADRDH